MSDLLPREAIAEAFVAACRAEVAALKPGNVHVHAAGHRMEVWQFEKSAEVAAPFIADPSLKVGRRIREAVAATFAAVGCNTNLGILLLCAPLAAAAGTDIAGTGLFERAEAVLAGLDVEDAAEAFAAIREANPAGLGKHADYDVAQPPPSGMSLLTAMQAAAHRDLIASEYATGFAITRQGCANLARLRAAGATETLAATSLYMSLLAEHLDSHVARKHGAEAAREVRAKARALWSSLAWGAEKVEIEPGDFARLMSFDSVLKARGLNPGTTADLVVAALFSFDLCARMGRHDGP
jgi:triphosphoribosyl-dephospho-CoA synthase